MADQVLLAFGRTPNTTSLGLDRAGVNTGADGAIIVDANSRTNIPNIYSVRDVPNQINLTPVAIRTPTACSAKKLSRSITPMCRPRSSPAPRSAPLA